jgi:nicotinamide riboside kinase
VPEYSRQYLYELGRTYNYDDILSIAKGQLKREKEFIPGANRVLFCDTEAIVTKIWCDVKYGKCHDWILDQIKLKPYDLYLLCNIDLPWEDDPLREHPEKRSYLFSLYHSELKERNLPFHIISGIGNSRLKEAIKIIDKSF